MRPARQPQTTWLGRFIRGHRPDRNPLRRHADHAESALLAVLITGFCAGAPALGYAAVTATHTASVRELHAQQAEYRLVRATLLAAAVDVESYPVATAAQADARWLAPDGRKLTGVVPTPANAKAGSTVLIWTDRSGHQVTPLQPEAVPEREALAALGAVTGLGGLLLVTGLAGRGLLNRRAMTAWDADWQATEPRWTSRR